MSHNRPPISKPNLKFCLRSKHTLLQNPLSSENRRFCVGYDRHLARKQSQWYLLVFTQMIKCHHTIKGGITMAKKDVKIVYAEPDDYFPKEIRKKYGLGEFNTEYQEEQKAKKEKKKESKKSVGKE